MLNVSEFRKKPDRLSDVLPWAFIVANSVVLNKDGAFLSTIQYRGPDLDSSIQAELSSKSRQLNNLLKRLGSGWCVYVEAQRAGTESYLNSTISNPVAYFIDEERKAHFEMGRQFNSSYFLTLTYLPPTDAVSKVENLFFEKPSKEKEGVNYQEILGTYCTEVRRIYELMQILFVEVKMLNDSELLTYLHSTISTKNHVVKANKDTFCYLDAVLPDTPLQTGIYPKLGEKHLRVVAILGYPNATEPGYLDALNSLHFSYRWVTRWIALSKDEAEKELKTFRRLWHAKRKGLGTLIKEALLRVESPIVDAEAVQKSQEANEALGELGTDGVAYGFYTNAIVLMDEDEKVIYDQCRTVERVLNALGFATKTETINSVDAWLGTIPGNARNNVRRPLLHTLNLAHLMPFSSVWSGVEKDEHFNDEPIAYCATVSGAAFRYPLHYQDVGHTMVVGPTGSGKSVFLNFLAAQFLRYKNAQVYIFDKGQSSRTLTAGVGGEFYELGAEQGQLSFQPLRNCDDAHERVAIQEWVLDLLIQEGVTITPSMKEEVWKKLEVLGTSPVEQRTMFGLMLMFQDELLRSAIQPYTHQGAYGYLLDSETDSFSNAPWQVFEMEHLLGSAGVVAPVLSYIFRRLEKNFTGAPTLLILDEAWTFLDNPRFAARIREWLKVLRKLNVSVIFATQSLADVESSSIAATIRESCPTKIYLPNPVALDDMQRKCYEGFGLNYRQIQLISCAIPKRDYYFTSPLGNRMFELAIGEFTKTYVAGASKERTKLVKETLEAAEDTLDFNARWAARNKIDWAIEAFTALKKDLKEAA